MAERLEHIPVEAEQCEVSEVMVMLALMKLHTNGILILLLHLPTGQQNGRPASDGRIKFGVGFQNKGEELTGEGYAASIGELGNANNICSRIHEEKRPA
jgi:hypothetical protein